MADAFTKSGYSMNKLAGEVGVSTPTFMAWVAAGSVKPAQDITANNLFKVCRLLKIRPDWVLTGAPPRGTSDRTDSSEEIVDANIHEKDHKSRVYLSSSDLNTYGTVSNEQLDEFIAELKAAVEKERLTPHRFFLLRELLLEGAQTQGEGIEKQQIKTRGVHGRRDSTRGKTGTRGTR
ncbi:hypothetical protein [Burkholderia cepacia]|uniref:hypothetical protein n=1 Tax=Burkholderia cepacia TaxID=292 RepID=UPI001CF4FB5F|nr:hypothetical protein [Burkholderia cepacia]MCA8326102.1 hypothetical protein [Burkholderia cepacia]